MIYLLIILLCASAFQLCSAAQCTTPNGEKGDCISIYKCLELFNAIATFNDTLIKYAQKSQCGYDITPLVCCPTKNVDTQPSHKVDDFLNNRRYCGYQHFDDYFTQKDVGKAHIDEFPWLASLLYSDGKNGNMVACGGALISEKYVLTAAHCTRSHDYDLVGVRLGEHNLRSEKDCSEGTEVQDCNDPVEEYGLTEVIRHPEYSLRTKLNDIALLKLNRTVTYSDFIRPICLPFPGTRLAKDGEVMTVSGWGRSSYAGDAVDTKKKILVELVPTPECKSFYNRNGKNITDTQICTKPKPNSADISCQGDSGGPVMFANKNQWHIEGILSFGTGCGLDTPDVNTKIVKYLDWILEKIGS